MNARSTVLTCSLVVGGLGVTRAAVAGRKPSARLVVGITVSTIILAGLADAAPALASAVAVLAATSAVLTAGPPVLAAVSKLTA